MSEADCTKTRLPRELWVVVGCSFLVALGFGVLAPALPAFASGFHVSTTAAAFVISVFALVRLVFAPTAGRLVSARGEFWVYVTGILIVAASTFAAGFAQTYWQLVAFRGLGGVGSAMFSVSAMSLLVRLAPVTVRGKATGMFNAGFLVGTVVGPAFGTVLVAGSLQLPFIVYTVMLVIAAAAAALALRHSVLAAVDTSGSPIGFLEAVRHRTFTAAVGSNFATGAAVFGLRMALLPLFVIAVLHRDLTMAGLGLTVFAIGNVAFLTFSGRLTDTWGRKPLAVSGLVILAVGTALTGFATTAPSFLVICVICGMGSGLLAPAQGAAVADVVGNRGNGGPALAGFQMSADVGAILGPLIAGVLVDQLSYQAAFALTALVLALAAVLWLIAPETLPTLPGTDPDQRADQVGRARGDHPEPELA
ncbi:MFS transporter [Pseudonocardiaceae bacterium YIM PH 21723]|nr:MFS transporter [Pseudonocardiaceae bacterium YIM PH 21723]